MTTRWKQGKGTGSPRTGLRPWGDRRISGLGTVAKPASIQHISSVRPGQRSPQQKPGLDIGANVRNALGEPISIREAAEMIGCSAWTIRQKYLPQGLPHLRSGTAGKLIFYRDQVVRWILQQQQQLGKGRR